MRFQNIHRFCVYISFQFSSSRLVLPGLLRTVGKWAEEEAQPY